MSMYLSNADVGPIGEEPGEFIDFPPRTMDPVPNEPPNGEVPRALESDR